MKKKTSTLTTPTTPPTTNQFQKVSLSQTTSEKQQQQSIYQNKLTIKSRAAFWESVRESESIFYVYSK